MTATETQVPRKFSLEQVRPFWAAVEECLVAYHGVSQERAVALVTREWDEHEARNEPYGDILYHEQPFRVASDLMGSSLDLTREIMPGYWELLKKHGW